MNKVASLFALAEAEGGVAIDNILSSITAWLIPLSGAALLAFPVAILLWTVIPNCCHSRATRKDEPESSQAKDNDKHKQDDAVRSSPLSRAERLRYCCYFFASVLTLLAALRFVDRVLLSWRPQRDVTNVILQPAWVGILSQAPWLVSHIAFAGVVGVFSFFATCIYFTVLDVCRSESKIQKDWFPSTWDMLAAGVPQSVIYIVANALSYRYGYQGIDLPSEAPRFCVYLEQIIIAFVIGDFLMYWEHRIMHMVPWLRTHIHSVHHAYHAPFGWAGGVVHPVEDAMVIVCQTITPVLCGHHPLSFWTFVFIWVILLVEEHSGHDVCWAPYNWLPFARCPWGSGAAPHDIHHYKVTKNYGFVLCVWDQLFASAEAVVRPPDLPKARTDTWWEHQSHSVHACKDE